MHKLIAASLIAVIAGAPAALAIEPIPGSLVYPTPPKTKLKKAPAGSSFGHQFNKGGRNYRETYRINPDRSLKLIERHRRTDD